MQFPTLYTPDQKAVGGPPSPEHMAEMGKLIDEMTRAGVLLATGGLLPMSKGGARVRRSGRKITVIDGPFAEAKEVVAGFALLKAKSRPEVLDLVRHFLTIAGDGESQVFQLMEPMDPRV